MPRRVEAAAILDISSDSLASTDSIAAADGASSITVRVTVGESLCSRRRRPAEQVTSRHFTPAGSDSERMDSPTMGQLEDGAGGGQVCGRGVWGLSDQVSRMGAHRFPSKEPKA